MFWKEEGSSIKSNGCTFTQRNDPIISEADERMDLLGFLQQKIIDVLEHGSQGISARGQSRLFGHPHVSAIILVRESGVEEEGIAKFRVYAELEDQEQGQCEAEFSCTCERLPGDGAVWRITELEVLDAAPLPR